VRARLVDDYGMGSMVNDKLGFINREPQRLARRGSEKGSHVKREAQAAGTRRWRLPPL